MSKYPKIKVGDHVRIVTLRQHNEGQGFGYQVVLKRFEANCKPEIETRKQTVEVVKKYRPKAGDVITGKTFKETKWKAGSVFTSQGYTVILRYDGLWIGFFDEFNKHYPIYPIQFHDVVDNAAITVVLDKGR